MGDGARACGADRHGVNTAAFLPVRAPRLRLCLLRPRGSAAKRNALLLE